MKEHIENLLEDELDRAYAAGIIDGEGCIRIELRKKKKDSNQYLTEVRVTNTDTCLIDYLECRFGGEVYERKNHNPARHKKRYEWMIRNKKTTDFLNLVYPYLQVKKKQAEILLKMQCALSQGQRISCANGMAGQKRSEERTEMYHNLYLQLKELNKKGPPATTERNNGQKAEATV